MGIRSIGRPTFGGLATGLDTTALLDGLLAIERLPLQRIQARRDEIDTQRGLMRDLNTKLLALRTAAQAVDKLSFLGEEGVAKLAGEGAAKEIRASSDYWRPRVAASFGGAASPRFDQLQRFGIRHQPNEALLAEWNAWVDKYELRLFE